MQLVDLFATYHIDFKRGDILREGQMYRAFHVASFHMWGEVEYVFYLVGKLL